MTNRIVLLVDTSDSALKQAKVTLEFEGLEVFAARDGEKALEIARTRIPALVISAVAFPGIGGYKLCKQLLDDEVTCGAKVILTYGSMDVFDRDRAHRSGAAGSLARPYLPSQLLARVSEVMGEDFVGRGDDGVLFEPDTIPPTEKFLSTAESAFLEDTHDEPATLRSDFVSAVDDLFGDATASISEELPFGNIEVIGDGPTGGLPPVRMDGDDLRQLVEAAVRTYLDEHLSGLVASAVDEALRKRKD